VLGPAQITMSSHTTVGNVQWRQLRGGCITVANFIHPSSLANPANILPPAPPAAPMTKVRPRKEWRWHQLRWSCCPSWLWRETVNWVRILLPKFGAIYWIVPGAFFVKQRLPIMSPACSPGSSPSARSPVIIASLSLQEYCPKHRNKDTRPLYRSWSQ
jgi:hypothetical protein